MKKQKMRKFIGLLLAVSLLFALTAVFAAAADSEVTGISVVTPPERTVYYEGGDDVDGDIVCDPTGIEVEISYADGTVAYAGAEDSNLAVIVFDYVVGENDAVVAYYDEANGNVVFADTAVQVTVKENPIVSVEITKMPDKTEYDIETDVLTKENFTLEKMYAYDPAGFDAILAELGMTYEEYAAMVSDEELAEIIFADTDALLMVETAGAEIKVTYSDGTEEVLTDEDSYITHLGYLYPVSVGQKANTVTEGENTMYISVMGKTAEFTVNVKKAAAATPDNGDETQTPASGTTQDDIKNPDIPKTGMEQAVTAAAVLMLVCTAGGALATRPARKEK